MLDHSGHHLIQACDGDLELVQRRLDSIRSLAREAQAGDVLLGAGVGSGEPIPYVPYVPAGWNPRPWRDPRPAYQLPTESEWENALQQVKKDLHEHSTLGLPGTKAFTIYAWNEYGEGAFVTPTRGEHYMKLKTIQRVFHRTERGEQ